MQALLRHHASAHAPTGLLLQRKSPTTLALSLPSQSSGHQLPSPWGSSPYPCGNRKTGIYKIIYIIKALVSEIISELLSALVQDPGSSVSADKAECGLCLSPYSEKLAWAVQVRDN